MHFAFTTIVTRTTINMDERTGQIDTDTDTETITHYRGENDQKTMRSFFEEVVSDFIPRELVSINRSTPMLLNTDRDVRMLTDNELNSSIHDFAVVTMKNYEPSRAFVCTFLVYVTVRKRLFYRL